MYKNRKFSRNNRRESIEKRKALNTIEENQTIKISRVDNVATTSKANAEYTFASTATTLSVNGEENIPSSQEPTQRYLSQRSTFASTLGRTQSRNSSYRPPNTYFELVLQKAGVLLDEGDQFVLSCDHVAFVSKFREILVKCQNYPENVENFKTGLREALSDKSKWVQKLLGGCTINAAGEQSVYQSQDSMIVNFLMIDFLIDHVLEVLLDKIESAACEDTTRTTNLNIPLLPLLLAQMRYITISHGDRIYTRIKDIFEKCTESAKWDIIANAEFILDCSKHDEFAQLLLDTMPESKDIFHSITIQTMTNLCLSTKMQAKLRCKTLAYIKDQCPSATLPLLIKLLLKILNEESDDCARELVGTLREILIWRTTSAANERQAQLELFKFIEQGLTRSKKFYFSWQKMIVSLPAHQFRSIDFIILLLLIQIKEDNSLYIENILRRRIKLDHITVEILNDTKNQYPAILEKYTNILMQILHDFLKEKHKSVADFARSSYGILFEICESIQKNILKKLLELTCEKSTQNLTNLALELLKALQRKYPKDVQNWGVLLMPLLDRLNELSLSQTRIVMEILCSIAYPAPTLTECPTLQDQIDMLVKKQLINRTAFVKKQGIISSVQLINSIARIEEISHEKDDCNRTYYAVSDLPEGRGKIAANLFERVHSSTMQCPQLMALFYDELACVCAATADDRANNLLIDKPFLSWLCELMTCHFQNRFVSEHSPQTIAGIQLTHQKCINSNEDSETEQESEMPVLAINFAEFVLKPAVDASSSVLILAPLFNWLRVLHFHHNKGSLQEINALLGCAIVLPTFFDDSNTDAIIYNHETQLQRKVLDIYFHCVNWMRETVSSFASQRTPMIRTKVLQRLSDLICTEGKIRELLKRAPADYTPPMCQFVTLNANLGATNKAGVRGRQTAGGTTQQKGSKTNQKVNQTEIEGATLNESTIVNTTARLASMGKAKTSNTRSHFENLYGPREIYRQMDSDLILVLHEKLNIKYSLPQEDIGKHIGLLEFRFVLNDLVCKLESVVGLQKFQSDQAPQQYIAKPHFFMSDLSTFLTTIVQNMDELSNAITAQLEQVERLYSHAELSTDQFGYMKVCFGLCLRLLSAYFSWSEFSDPSRGDLLKESLLALLERSKSQQLRTKPSATLAMEVFNKCIKYESSIVDLKTALHAYQLAVILKRHSSASDDTAALDKQAFEIRKLCKKFITRKWFNYDGLLEKGTACNIYLDELVKGFLKNSEYNRQRNLLRIILGETKQLSNKDGALISFPNFKHANFPIFFRGLCETFISSVSDSIAKNNGAGGAIDKLTMWENSCELMNSLLDILQSLEMPRNFPLFLKHSHLYLKMVLQNGLQVYEQYLRQSPERVNALLQNLQVTTRFLHNLCCHSKAIKNTAIINQIPFLRETLENFLFHVKALLAVNKCGSAFSMGTLKNTDLHGVAILSQTGTFSSTGHGSEEDIPDDDDVSVDETVLGLDEETGRSSTEPVVTPSRRETRSKCF